MRTTLILALLMTASPVFSDCLGNARGESICGAGPCAMDDMGEVACAPHADGTAVLNKRGEVVCGMGQCVPAPFEGYYCAIEPGGAVMNAEGSQFGCVGGCELASKSLCQQEFHKAQI